VTYSVTPVRDKQILTCPKEDLMSQRQTQLKLAYVNCSIVSNRPNSNAISTAASSSKLASSRRRSPPCLSVKVERLTVLAPHAADLVERLVDDLLVEAEGRKL
jgi:hypothetical protein